MSNTLVLPVKNLVVEWRFAPQLAIYSAMDKIGIHFAEDFPDWERSPLTLELKNLNHWRRFFMSCRRCFFDVVNPSSAGLSTEIDKAYSLFDRTATELELRQIERIGFRQWFAFPCEDDFELLVKRSISKFHPENQSLKDLLRAEFTDIGYVVDMKTADGWKYNLRAGPMKKEQWFSIVQHERQIFKSQTDFDGYETKFPSQFFYVDIDCHSENVPRSDLRQLVDKMHRKSHEIAKDLSQFFESRS
jgi:hypothetical protein